MASTLEPNLQVGLGQAVAEQRNVQEHASMQLARLPAIVGGNSPVRWSPDALRPEVASPTLHILDWMAQAEPDAGRQYSTDPFLAAAGQPTVSEMAARMAAKGKPKG